MVLRLALLICDTPLPAVVEAHGDYLAIFSRFFETSLPDPQVEFSLDGFDVVNKQEYPSLDAGYDAVVITGSCRFLCRLLDSPFIGTKLPLHMMIFLGYCVSSRTSNLSPKHALR
jgi:hypothetical protein